MAARQLTRDENLKILRELYGDKFDYTETEFKTSRDNITYWCTVHNCYVTQNLGRHRKGQQCPQCAQESRNKKNSKTFEYFVSQAIKVFSNRFKYDESAFKNMITPMRIYCTKHGWFEQTPSAHLRYAYGCPKCAKEASYGPKENLRSDKIDILNRLKLIYPNFNEYDFSELPNKIRLDEKQMITHIPCNTVFFPKISSLFNNGHNGHSECPTCSRLKRYKLSDGKIDVIQCAKDILGDNYSFEKTVFKGMRIPWIITCKDHGDFECLPQNTLRGTGCPCCAIQKVSEQKRMSFEEFVSLAEEKHGKDTFTYFRDTYGTSQELMTMQCNTCTHVFAQRPNNHLQGQGCPNCAKGKQVSKWELEVRDFLSEYGINIITNDRTIIAPKEIDIYLPEYKLGIECHGIYYRTERFGWDKQAHLHKLELADSAGIRLLQFFEDEWMNNKEICKSIILNSIGKSKYYFGARECKVKSVEYSEAKSFLDKHHLQGSTPSTYNYGLYYTLNGKDYLVSLMTFGYDRFTNNTNPDEYELIRFCNKINYTIPGAASKLFNHFIREHNPSSIKSYCNRRLYQGSVYRQLGMKLKSISVPNYFYVASSERLSRHKFQKKKLIENYGCPKDMTEHDFCRYTLGLYRIYDCGNLVFYWNKK